MTNTCDTRDDRDDERDDRDDLLHYPLPHARARERLTEEGVTLVTPVKAEMTRGVPLATLLKLKGQLREYRARCATAEARVQALQTTLAELLQGLNHGEGGN
jgi:hypothetical protein